MATSDELREHVSRGRGRADVRDAVARVYADLAIEIDARRPVCKHVRRCCRFDEFGHRLYVTTIELAAFVAGLPADSGNPHTTPAAVPSRSGNSAASTRIRPFGCRMFFCDSTATEVAKRASMSGFMRRSKRLHGELDVPYRYVEWRQALKSLGFSQKEKLGEGVTRQARQASDGRLSLPQLPF
jgi:hypothetical protein